MKLCKIYLNLKNLYIIKWLDTNIQEKKAMGRIDLPILQHHLDFIIFNYLLGLIF